MAVTVRKLGIMAGMFSLSACAGGAATTTATRAPLPTVPSVEAEKPAEVTVRAPEESSVRSIIGKEARALTDRFGTARIDLREGVARKLQFAGERCVLDIFLYPVAANTPPVATHVEARLRSDGSNVAEPPCIQELARR